MNQSISLITALILTLAAGAAHAADEVPNKTDDATPPVAAPAPVNKAPAAKQAKESEKTDATKPQDKAAREAGKDKSPEAPAK